MKVVAYPLDKKEHKVFKCECETAGLSQDGSSVVVCFKDTRIVLPTMHYSKIEIIGRPEVEDLSNAKQR